ARLCTWPSVPPGEKFVTTLKSFTGSSCSLSLQLRTGILIINAGEPAFLLSYDDSLADGQASDVVKIEVVGYRVEERLYQKDEQADVNRFSQVEQIPRLLVAGTLLCPLHGSSCRFQTDPVEHKKQYKPRQSQLYPERQIDVMDLNPQIPTRLVHGDCGGADSRTDHRAAEDQFGGHQGITPALLRRTALVLLNIGDRTQAVEIVARHQWQAGDDDQQNRRCQETLSPAAEAPQI